MSGDILFCTPSEQERTVPDEIAEKVMSIVASVKRIPPNAISIESTFEQLGIDSLDSIDILFELEDAFAISIPDEQARSIHDVKHMVDGVRKLAADGAGNARCGSD
jgi:acyl carrier protein